MKKAISLVLTLALGMVSVSLAAEDTWTYKAPMPTARGFVSGCVLDGRIYVVGGFPTHFSVTSAVEMYDPTTNTWTRMANMPSGRCGHATCAFDGKIYVFGGTSPDPYSTARRNVYVYDAKSDTWTRKTDMPYANALCGIALIDDTMYLVGGALSASSQPVSRVMAYNSTTESWAQKADMPTARGWLSACVIEGKIYAIGGAPQDYQTGCYKNVEVYDPSTDTWTRKSDMPTARAAVSTCVVNRRIYATGGFSPAGVFATNEMYNPATDTWITKSSMQQKRLMSFVGSIADKVYVAGGSYPDSQGQPVVLSTLEEYDTGLGKLVFDFNGDGIIDSVDVCMMIDYWATNEPLYDIAPPPFGDGIVDVQDLIVLAEHLFEDTRLIAHWKLDETEGDIAHNSIGDEHGILNGEPVWQPTNGKKGGALEFDGIDDYITTGPVLNPADGAFSVFAWVKGGKPGQVVISQRDTGGETWLGTESTSGKLMTGLMAPPAGRTIPHPLESDIVITDNQWHHIGVTWDGSYRVLYVDGVEAAKDATPWPLLKSSTGGLHIGADKNIEAETCFSGLIDDVRIHNVALSVDKIAAMAK